MYRDKQRRQVSEHCLARLVQLGMRQARYFGKVKTRFQLLMAATVANLTLIVIRMGMIKTAGCKALSVAFSFAQGFYHPFGDVFHLFNPYPYNLSPWVPIPINFIQPNG